MRVYTNETMRHEMTATGESAHSEGSRRTLGSGALSQSARLHEYSKSEIELGHMQDRNWQDFGLCGQVDPELFFPDKGTSNKTAKGICEGCEVKLQCLEDALKKKEQFGVRGGLSVQERRILAKSLSIQQVD
jgi:WhiB family redox-sensing transcriptional regulator